MDKKKSLITLGAIAFVGSIIGFVGTNFFMQDVLNKSANMFSTLLTSLPMLMLGSLLVSAFLYVIRLYKRPKTFKKLTKHYLTVGLVLSGVGLLTAFLAGILTYGSFFKPYPFYGYLIIMIVLFAVLIWAAIYFMLKLKNRPEDEETYKVKASHVFSTIGWFLFIALVFNRTGAFLAMPFYVQWRTLYLSFPFYLYLLCPVCIGAVKVLTDFDVLNGRSRLILPIAAGALQIVLFVVVIIIGMNNSTLISAVSPAMPLERLASAPLEILIHFASMLAVSVILVVQCLRNKNADK